MTAYSGWGRLPLFLAAVPLVLLFAVSDANDHDWRAGACAAMIGALVLAGLNLAVAAGLNGGEGGAWRGDHRAGGTAMQSFTPDLLSMAGAAGAAWTAQWITWPVAILLYVAGTVAYFAVPRWRERRARAAVIARRRAFAAAKGWRFAGTVAGLTTRWDFGPFAMASTFAEVMNRPTAKLRGHYAGMSGSIDGFAFTIVDAFRPQPWAVFRAWSRTPVTVCAVHLSHSLPGIRVGIVPGRARGRVKVAVDCVAPAYAEAVVNGAAVDAMVEWSLDSFEIQGCDVLTVLPSLTFDTDEDSEEDNVAVVESLIAVLSCLDVDPHTWRSGPAGPLPIPHDAGRG
ncbi:hypothetical protein Dvina_31600 [Dactylosporangium vinaceum]|uniref:Uncharacterized protein n=1 Tax=Dactylosporangium vinaceum TaxID=53362 RepID=A0ABV5M7B6_9ACTN|nr:hypothetical protein [Dactylosporangium vinaceum]UAB92847.1 hypothetical protein Dvina_31600 [Dactylosporangium vinaceum]